MKVVEKARQAWIGVRYAARMRAGRRVVVAHLREPGRHPLPMPTFVQLRLTNVCNLRCRMCGQWGDTGVYREPPAADAAGGAGVPPLRERLGLERQLSLDEYRALLDDIAPFRPLVSLFGGEPMLYPQLIPLVREIKQRGLTLTMITNGSLLARHAEALVEAGMDSIAISFDGHPELHDDIRGQRGSYAQAAAGVQAIAAARARRGRAHPVLMALLPITELNHDRIEPTVKALSELPLDLISIGLRWYVPPAAGAAHEQRMQRELGTAAPSWKGFEFSWPDGPGSPSAQAPVRVLRSLRRRRLLEAARRRPWVTFVPELRPEQVPVYLTRHSETFGHDLCPVAWYFAQVQPDGDVAFCGDFPDYVIGNVRGERFGAVWSGPRARAFRQLLRRQPLPVCARCCGSFVYGRWSRDGVAAVEP